MKKKLLLTTLATATLLLGVSGCSSSSQSTKVYNIMDYQEVQIARTSGAPFRVVSELIYYKGGLVSPINLSDNFIDKLTLTAEETTLTVEMIYKTEIDVRHCVWVYDRNCYVFAIKTMSLGSK